MGENQKDKKKCAVAICCAALLTAESVVPTFAATDSTKPKKMPAPEKTGIVKGLPAPLAEFLIEDKGGETNISDLCLSVTNFSGIDAIRSKMYLKNTDGEIETIEINENKIYRFEVQNLPEGNYTVGYEIIDEAGEEFREEKEFIVDSTKPVIEMTHTSTEPIEKKAVDVSFKFKDANLDKKKIKITVLKDKEPYEKAFAESEDEGVVMSATFEEDGKYEITAEAEDKRGNKAEVQSVSFEIDKTAPEVEAKNTLKNEKLSKDAHVKAFSDVILLVRDNNFKSLNVTLEKGGETVYTKDYDTMPEEGKVTLEEFDGADGNYTLKVHGSDTVGNEGDATFEIIKDTVGPVITFEGAEDNLLTNSNITFKAILNDDNLDNSTVKFEVTKDGEPVNIEEEYTDSITKVFDETGRYVVKVTAKDKSMNEASKTISFEIDKVLPKLSIKNTFKDEALSKDKNIRLFSQIEATLKEDNLKKILVEVKKGDKVEYSEEILEMPKDGIFRIENFEGEDGKYSLHIKIEDKAGNITEEALDVVKDNKAPLITFEGVKDFINKDFTLKAIIEDDDFDINDATYEVKKDGNTFEGKASYIENRIEELFTLEGKYEVKVKAKDKTLNEATKSVSFEIDKTLPVITAENLLKDKSLASDNHVRKFSEIKITAKDKNLKDAVVKIEKDGEEVYSDKIEELTGDGIIKIKDFEAADGNYTLTVSVKDKAENIKEERYSVIKDTNAPKITFEGMKDFINKDFTLKAIIEDDDFDISDATYEVKKDGSSFESKANYLKDRIEELFTLEGKYEVKVKVKDKTLNEAAESVSFEIDKTLPVIKAENLLKDKSLTSDNHVRSFSEIKITAKDKNLKDAVVKIEKDGKEVYSDNIEKLTDDGIIKIKDFEAIDGSYTLTVSVKDKAENIKEETYSVIKDTDSPKITFEGAKDFNNKDFTLRATLKDSNLDVSSVVYEVFKNGNKIASSETLDGNIISEVFSSEGEYTVKVKAKDNSLNEGKAEISFEVDKTAPKVDAKNLLKGAALEKDNHIKSFDELQVLVKDKNAKTVKVEIVKGDKVVYTKELKDLASENTINIKNFEGEDGAYFLRVASEDKAENITEKRIDFIKDTKGPKITFEGAKDFNNKDFTLKASLKDENIDLNSVRLEIIKDGVVIKNESVRKDVIEELFSKEGEYTVKVSAKDLSLNESSKSISFEVDKTLPKITVGNLLKGDSLLKDKYVREFEEIEPVIKEKNLESIIVKIKDKNEKVVFNKELDKMPADGKIKIENVKVEDGVYTLEVVAKDKAENTKREVIEFIKDTKTPDITFEGVKDTLKKTFSKVDVILTSKIIDKNLDASSVKYEVFRNGKSIKSEKINKDTISEVFSIEGDYEIKLSGRDFALNEKEASVFFEVDKTLPSTTISGIPQHGYLHKLGEITVKSTDKNFEKQTVKILRGDKVVVSKNDVKGEDIAFSENLSDGRYEIVVEAEDKAGNVRITRDNFIIDTAAPLISFDGATEGRYYNKDITLGINVKEENFKDNSVSVEITRTLRGRTVNIPFTFNSTGVNSKNSKIFAEDGTYTVIVKSEDKVGNVAREQKITFTVDKTSPKVDINNLLETYGPNGDINSTISIEDDYKDKTSVTIRNDNTGKLLTATLSRGEYVDIYNIKGIKKVLSNDGKYTVTVSAEDKAGNSIEKTKGFIVNRFGSTFSFVEKPREIQKKLKNDVKIREVNLSSISSYDVRITKDGKKLKTVESVTRVGNIYNIPKENFKESGVYKIDIVSTDTAGNTSEMIKSKGCDYKFTVDKDAPSVYLVGAKSNTVYKENSLKVYIEAEDAMTGIKDIKAKVNGDNVKVSKEKDTGKYYIKLKEGFNQNVKVTITDNAGNESTVKLEKVSVSTGVRATIMQNKLVSALAAIGIGLAGTLVFVFKRKKDEDKEE